MLPPGGLTAHSAGHSLSQWPDSTRDHLPNPSRCGGNTPSSDCNAGSTCFWMVWTRRVQALRSDTKASANAIANTAVFSASHRCGIFGPFTHRAPRHWSLLADVQNIWMRRVTLPRWFGWEAGLFLLAPQASEDVQHSGHERIWARVRPERYGFKRWNIGLERPEDHPPCRQFLR